MRPRVIISAFMVDPTPIFAPGPLILVRDILAIILLIAAFLTDGIYQKLPVIPLAVGGALLFLLNIFSGASPLRFLIGAAIGISFFLVQSLVSRRTWVGDGDAWLGGLLGALLGWQLLLVALFLSYAGAAIIAVPFLLTKRWSPHTKIPFGSFLAAAGLIALFFGQTILSFFMVIIDRS